jgi:hypothetical protein
VLPPSSRHRERIVDQEVMKLRLREERRRLAEGEDDRPHGEPPVRPRSLLVAVDLYDNSATAAIVAVAGALAAALGAEVILAGVAPLAPIDALTHSQVTEAARSLPADVRHRTLLRWGEPGPVIVDAARQEAVDLIVVSMRPADRYVLHHSEVPVLAVPVEPPADAAA